MFEGVGKHINAAMVVAVVALVFAMTGGAFAITITSGGSHEATSAAAKKSKGKSTKGTVGPKGPAGPRGATGSQGPIGPAGPAGPIGPLGPQGSAGQAGTDGKDGKDGVSVTSAAASTSECKAGGTTFTSASGLGKVCNGEQGKEGTFGGQVLPVGKTLKGTYAAEAFSEVATPTTGFGKAATGVSFALPVGSEPAVHYVKISETPPTGCTGTVQEPGAEKGNLCVFGENEENIFLGNVGINLRGSPTATIGFEVVALAGAKGNIYISGTWAVTAG